MAKKQNKRVTIYDLATELNVAPSTVSRALKDHFSIGSETITAVKNLALKRGYRPNILASSLRNQQTNTIGVLVAWLNRPFQSSLIGGIEEAAREAGYNVIISQSQDSYEQEVANTKALFDCRVQAIIATLAMETTDYQHFEDVNNNGTPVVFVDRVPTNHSGHQVTIDNFKTALDATQHLIDQGYRKIALFSGSLHQQIYFDRQRGYLTALKNNGIEPDEKYIGLSNRLSIEEGYRLTEEMLQLPEPPRAIFSTNDSAAIGGIKCAKDKGLSIPEDLAFVGMNDDPLCTIIEPNLSSMSHPAAEMGRLAFRQALEIISMPDQSVQSTFMVRLNTELKKRASS